ncbi:PKD domain-containing protein [Alteromonas macleodii]|uniref:PKD domain-containing protein n=1 Tax=Alteromonas macleodii TaxID=28108 RepID=UPI0036598940
MSLPLANTVQMGVRGDSTPPVINSSGVNGYAPLDKITLVSGLTATDNELGNITSYISPIGDFYSGFIGSFEHDFVVRDRWGNTATATATINVEGAYYLQETPYYDDFSQGLGEHWIKENGDFDAVNGALVAIGSQPASPRWNALVEADSNAHVQAVFNLNGVTQVGGPIIRYVDSNNFYYANFNIGSGLKLVKRVGGDYFDVITTEISVPLDEDFTVGIRAYTDQLALIYNGQVVGETVDSDNLYGNKHGVLLNTTSHEIKSYWMAASDININLLSEGVMFPNGNQQPTANAGPDQSVAAGVEFTLDGTGSEDADGTIVEWRWTQTAGDTVTLNLEDPARPTATSPSRTIAQTLTFQLITVDDEGAESAPGTVNVNVAAVVLSEILKVIERLDFDLTTQGDVNAYFGRANREVMKLKPSDPTGLALDADGFMMLDSNTIEEIKVIAEGSSISSKTDSINIEGSEMLVRLGDLEASKNGSLYFSIVVFVEGDTKGVVVSSKGSSGNKPMSYVTL